MRKSLWTTFTSGAVRISTIVAACLFLSITCARADTVYTYTGLNFDLAVGLYTPMDKVTGTFVLSSPLPAGLPPGSDESALLVSWSMSDGVNTFTGTGPTLTVFDVATGASGEISDRPGLGDWDVAIRNSVGEIETLNQDSEHFSEDTAITFNPDPNIFNLGGVGLPPWIGLPATQAVVCRRRETMAVRATSGPTRDHGGRVYYYPNESLPGGW